MGKADYAAQIAEAQAFYPADQMTSSAATPAMQAASDRLEFETAALWRNRIRALTAIPANQANQTHRLRYHRCAPSKRASCCADFLHPGRSKLWQYRLLP